MHKTSVIILHYGSISNTLESVNALKRNNSDYSFHTIVISNSKEKDLVDSIKKIDSSIDIISNLENLGFAEGNNVGIKSALSLGSKYIILLNNDTLSSGSLIKNIVKYSENNPQTGLISPKIYFAKGHEYHKNIYENHDKGRVLWYAGGQIDWQNCYASHRGIDEVDRGQYDKEIITEFATGCCMLIKREVIEKIGYFDRKYFLYYEDVDYSIRAAQSGFGVYYCPDVYLWHKNASTSGKPGSPVHIYYQTRNRLYFGFKYAPIRTKKSMLVESIRTFTQGGIRRKAIKDYYSGRMGKGSL